MWRASPLPCAANAGRTPIGCRAPSTSQRPTPSTPACRPRTSKSEAIAVLERRLLNPPTARSLTAHRNQPAGTSTTTRALASTGQCRATSAAQGTATAPRRGPPRTRPRGAGQGDQHHPPARQQGDPCDLPSTSYMALRPPRGQPAGWGDRSRPRASQGSGDSGRSWLAAPPEEAPRHSGERPISTVVIERRSGEEILRISANR
jgi:hypothetical protein